MTDKPEAAIMTDEKDSKQMLIELLYNRIDAGLHKKDAYDLADAIENLIDERINKMLQRMTELLSKP